MRNAGRVVFEKDAHLNSNNSAPVLQLAAKDHGVTQALTRYARVSAANSQPAISAMPP